MTQRVTITVDVKDAFDKVAVKQYIAAQDMALAIWEIKRTLNNTLNNGMFMNKELTDEEHCVLSHFGNRIDDILIHYSIDIEELNL